MKNTLYISIFILAFLIFSDVIKSQNMIGLTKKEIQKQMTSNFPKFTENSFGISTNMNTLKYIDSKADRTLIFYFDKTNLCNYSKLIEDISTIDARIKEFNGKYKSSGNLQWTEIKNGKNYTIKIEKEEYIYNVIITD